MGTAVTHKPHVYFIALAILQLLSLWS